MKRVIGIIVILLAVCIVVIPQFTKCDNSKMACNFTAKAEIALAIPIAVEGLVLILGRKESTLGLAIVGAAMGISVILVSYVLIGACNSTMMTMDCQTIMKPVLLILGILVILVNGWLLWLSKPATT